MRGLLNEIHPCFYLLPGCTIQSTTCCFVAGRILAARSSAVSTLSCTRLVQQLFRIIFALNGLLTDTVSGCNLDVQPLGITAIVVPSSSNYFLHDVFSGVGSVIAESQKCLSYCPALWRSSPHTASMSGHILSNQFLIYPTFFLDTDENSMWNTVVGASSR